MNQLNKKNRILSIFAHREDHIVFGWPILQRKDDNKVYLLTCVNEHCEIIKASCILEDVIYVGNCGLKNGFASPHRNINKNKFIFGSNQYSR